MQSVALLERPYRLANGAPGPMMSSGQPWPEAELRAAEGGQVRPPADVERFREIYRLNYAPLVGYALRRAPDRDEAGDVVAETFLVAWRNLDRVPAGDEARLWLYATARRVLANQRRSHERRQRLARRIAFEIDPTPRPPIEGDPTVVGRALARLSPEDRNLLGLVAWEGLRPAEIADVLGCSVGAARIRTFRARRRLAQELARLGYRAGGGVLDVEDEP